MGCTPSMNADAAANSKQVPKYIPQFKQGVLKNEPTEATMEHLQAEEAMMGEMKPEDMLMTVDNIEEQRAGMYEMLEPMLNNELKAHLVDKSEAEFTTKDGTQRKILVTKLKTMANAKKAPALIYAHGGGGVFFDATIYETVMSYYAENLNCVVFNIDFRNGPEVKAPTGQQDFVDAICHIVKNADSFGIDCNKVCLSGCSGGGWIIVGATNLLTKANAPELKNVKGLLVHAGMLSNETSKVPHDQLNDFEGGPMHMQDMNTSLYKLHATDMEKQKNDCQLYPGLVPDNLLAKYPKVAVFTSEFDFYRRDNIKFAERCKAHGKLFDISVMPGVIHGYMDIMSQMDTAENKQFFQEQKLTFNTFVGN